MDGDSGVQLGVFTFNQGIYEDAMRADIEDYREAVGAQTVVHAPSPRVESLPVRYSERISGIPAASDHIPLPVNPSLYARVKLLLNSPPTG